jgi:hypothetical protein
MPKPSDDLSDQQLHKGLASGEFQERDALIAQEILRRRHDERARSGRYQFGWLGAALAAIWLWLKFRVRRPQ